jgi:hypothetical protein
VARRLLTSEIVMPISSPSRTAIGRASAGEIVPGYKMAGSVSGRALT